MYHKKTFREKLADTKDFPRVEPLTKGMRRRYGPGTILLPAPWQVDELMRQVRKGQLTTIPAQRKRLEAEGHQIEARSQRLFVRDHARFLARLD